jgi:hypothetical protein
MREAENGEDLASLARAPRQHGPRTRLGRAGRGRDHGAPDSTSTTVHAPTELRTAALVTVENLTVISFEYRRDAAHDITYIDCFPAIMTHGINWGLAGRLRGRPVRSELLFSGNVPLRTTRIHPFFSCKGHSLLGWPFVLPCGRAVLPGVYAEAEAIRGPG